MNRLLVPPSSFYNPNGPSSMGLGSGVNGTPSIQQAALMMHHHHQQQQQQQNAAHSQGSQMPSEKLAIGSSGFKIATSLESTATTHHFPRQITSVSSTGFDLAAAVSAARSSQAAAAAAAMHAPPTSTVSLGAPPNFNPNQQPLHVPTHNMLFPQPTHPAAAAALFSAGHPGAAGIHPLLAAAAASGHFPGYHSPDGFGPMDFNMITRRKNATRETTSALKAWLNEHKKNPYPTKGEKIMLAIITKMTLTQVSTWFANARRRLKKENKMTWAQGSSNNDCDEEDEEDDDLDDDLMDDDDKDARRDLEESFTSSSLLHQLHTAQKPSQLGSHFPTEDLGLRIETNVPNPNKRSSSADALTFSNLINSTSSLQPNSACHESDPNSPTSRSESDVSSQSRSRNRHLISTPLQVVFPNNNKPISNTTGRKDSKTDTSVKKSKIWSIADLAASPSTSSEISTKSNCQNSPASFTSPVNQMSPIWKSPKTTLEGFPDHLGPESANILKVENFYGRSHMGATAHPGFYPGYGSHASPGAMSAAISAGFHPTFPSPVSVAMFNFANSQTTLPKNF